MMFKLNEQASYFNRSIIIEKSGRMYDIKQLLLVYKVVITDEFRNAKLK